MSAAQLPLALAQRHHNRQLFADRYLDETLPRRDAWLALAAEAAPALARVRAILAAFVPSANEAQTERDLVRPVLEALGHTFEVQAALRTPRGTKRPDYLFYHDVAALAANRGRALAADDLRAAFAVGDAKSWERRLDVSTPGDDEDLARVPADQIAFYMRHAGTPWGILTNGRRWRLYHHDSVERQDRYYEVDLKDLAEAGESEPFLYFYAFFRRAAFDAPVGDALTLDGMLRESVDYARGVSDSLKSQVFDALRHLAQGFLDYPRNQLAPAPEALGEIYASSLIILYRLLFVLYAEARELLPLRESAAYRESYSLYALARDVARRLDGGVTLLADTGQTWARLRDLFAIINAGSPPLKVATFNGGLFDPRRHPFLERYTVGDAQLQLALDKLARVVSPQSGAKEFIDYRDLAERHLGTIYEGLLEYHLVPVSRTADGFTIELVNDKGERHRTGSYYTPDFVVRYIVEQTLRPILDAAVAGKQTDEAKIAAVLEVNCIDPAMGSGHFPVAAMEYIARYLVELGVRPPAEAGDEPDLTYWKRRVAQSCIYGVDLNPLAVDLAKLSLWLATAAKGRPLSFLDHHLRGGNALVGARVSELDGAALPAKKAKRSKKEAAAAEAGQLSLLDDAAFAGAMSSAVGSMWLIEGSAGRTLGEVKEQEELYERVRRELVERFALRADLRAAAALGAAPDDALLPRIVEYERRGALDQLPPALLREVEQVRRLAADRRFFHWDLEFPEVFFDRFGRPLGEQGGFDAVVGNPPYVRQEQLGPLKPYLQAAFPETYHGMNDLYVYFYQQGMRLLREGGRMSYIVTNKWLRAGYGEGLRGFFAERAAIERIVDFGHAPIFAGADVFPVIMVVEKPAAGADLGEREVRVTSFPREALGLVSLDSYVDRYSHPVPQRRLGRAPWGLESSGADDLMEKIRRAGTPLAEFAGVKPYRGVLTGYNEAFLIDTPTKERLVREDPRSAEIIRPYLRGQDMERWRCDWIGLWMIFARRGFDIDAYPAIKDHLLQFREGLEPKPREWVGEKWSGRKPGTYKWYEIQDSVEYWKLLEQPKIMYPDITWRSQFSLDTGGHFSNNTVYFLPTSSPWLLAVLNSPLMWWFAWRGAAHGKDEALRFFNDFVEQIPIPPLTDAIRAEVEPAVERLIAITRDGQRARRAMLDWLRAEFGVEQAGQKLEAFAELGEEGFVEEVRKRRPRAAGKLSPAGLRSLRDGYAEQAAPTLRDRAEALRLERHLADLVNTAYGLTPEDIALLWQTAPPRMPVGRA